MTGDLHDVTFGVTIELLLVVSESLDPRPMKEKIFSRGFRVESWIIFWLITISGHRKINSNSNYYSIIIEGIRLW